MQTNPLALFGDHLARLRKARGWSQEKLALESGLARSYVSGIERGRRNVALVNICVLADTLGVPTSEMLRFAQATSGAADNAAPSDRTPLPQISRSLCRLENRDQVWLAEIIRSLSSRLSHAAPPVTPSPSANPSAMSGAAHDDAGNEREDLSDRDDHNDFNEADEAIEMHPAFGHASRHTAIEPGLAARHQLDASPDATYRMADDMAEPADTTTHIREPERTSSGNTSAAGDPDAAHRSDAIAHEDSRRFHNDDEV